MTRAVLCFGAIFCLLLPFSPAFSQVTNLTINGSSTNFTMTSGDVVNWSFNVPAGGTAQGEMWLDLNLNHAIDPGTDRLLLRFSETDGDTIGIDGPPDMDGIVNGEVQLSLAIGLAPQDYVVKFSHNGVGESVWGQVAHLAAPAFTVSGTVYGPPGADLRYLLIEASRDWSGGVPFWHGLTDSTGLYTIELNSDTAGNPWHIGMNDLTGPYTVARRDTEVTIDGNVTGIDFTILAAAAQVYGYVIDDAGDSLAFTDVYIARNDSTGGGGGVYHYTRTDPSGRFWVGVPLGELDGHTWTIGMSDNGQGVTTHMLGFAGLPALTDGDSIQQNIISYRVNSTIDGFVQFNGAPPDFRVRLFATNPDSGESFVWTDSATGAFSIPVSDMVYNYGLQIHDDPGPYQYPSVTAHPGDAGVIYNITITGIGAENDRFPDGYALGQNYPNPFNPATTITYGIPSRAHVVLAVYDVLGREVAVLLNEVQEPGIKSVKFDASSLPSGVYTYRIVSGTFTESRKMMLLK